MPRPGPPSRRATTARPGVPGVSSVTWGTPRAWKRRVWESHGDEKTRYRFRAMETVSKPGARAQSLEPRTDGGRRDMSRDDQRIDQFRRTLAQDGYHLEIDENPPHVLVTITADPETCSDCLAPKPLLRAMLAPALDVEETAIELRYPDDV